MSNKLLLFVLQWCRNIFWNNTGYISVLSFLPLFYLKWISTPIKPLIVTYEIYIPYYVEIFFQLQNSTLFRVCGIHSKFCIKGIKSKNIIIQPSFPGRMWSLVAMAPTSSQVHPLVEYLFFPWLFRIKAHIVVMWQVLDKSR